LAFFAFAGCQQIGALWAVSQGGDTTKAEFKLTAGPLAVLVDNPEQFDIPPEATQTLYEALARKLEEKKINQRVVAWSEYQRLRQTRTDFEDMAVRQVGEKLGAEQVLCVRFNWWALRENPSDPHLHPASRMSLKVVSTERKHDVRLWPLGGAEKTVSVTLDPNISDAASAESAVSRELATKLAVAIAKHFYDYKQHDDE
jgi:hypothetical protein